jgi:pimeloyl-ACP methyl ester carboxylesterase
MSRHLILLIHGINTGRTSPSWPKHFTGWSAGHPGLATEAIYYEAGPFPLTNHLWKNPRLARDLVSRLETRYRYDGPRRLHLVAHSNGAAIAMQTMRRLAAIGQRVETAILTGAAIHSDVEKSGLHDLISAGWLGRAIAYSSPDDGVTRRSLEWIPGGYGALGSRGFRRRGTETGLRVEGRQPLAEGAPWGADRHRYVTRWFEDFSHGQYFAETEREATFACLLGDMLGPGDERGEL